MVLNIPFSDDVCIAAVVEAGKAALVCGNAAFGAPCEDDDDVFIPRVRALDCAPAEAALCRRVAVSSAVMAGIVASGALRVGYRLLVA